MKEPLISIIVPVYKVEKYLDRCIESIVKQTYQNLEIVLIDDGSPDLCPEICDEWAKRDSRIQVIHKKNGGLSDARNIGMSFAKGEFVGFVDSDDWVNSEMYSKLMSAILQDNSDIAACAVKMVWENTSNEKLLTTTINCVLDRHEAQLELLLEAKLKQPVWYKLYRKSIICDISFEINKYHEDVFWSYQAIGNARRVSIIDYVGYCYLQRTDSIMGEGYSLKRLDVIEALERRQDYLERNFPDLANRAKCSLWFSCMYHGQKILRYLPPEKQINSMQYLSTVLKRHPFSKVYLDEMEWEKMIWISVAKVSLETACKIRNVFKIGM